MTPPNPQPKTSWSSLSRATPSGAGTNAKGSGSAWTGGKRRFQWGHGQYGYINPQGTINWNARAPKEGQRLGGFGDVSKWAKQSGQAPTDPYGMTVRPKVAPPGYLDPAYGAVAAKLTGERAMQQRQLANQLAELKAQYDAQFGDFSDQYAKSFDQMKASFGSRGISRSGIAGREITDAERGYARGLEALQQQFGAPAQERTLATQRLVDANLRAQLAAEQKLAKERWKAENEYRKAQGLEPRTLPKTPTGFEKRGSTWFYTNPQGVSVSVQGNPYQRQISVIGRMIRQEKSSPKPRQDKIEAWQKRIEQLKGKM